MKILNLKLLNFRNYEKLDLVFSPNKNIIIGANGMGKTNIVEAIYTLAFTKSFRGSKDNVIIRKNTDLARIEGIIDNGYRNEYKIIIKDNDKTVKINNKEVNRISDYLSNINLVLFTSEDLKLIKDTPSTRRKLINIELSQYSNDYLKILTYYNKVLKQRNSYLKNLYINGNASKDYLFILTDQLIELGLKINKYRTDFINLIEQYLSNNYEKITSNKGLKLNYISEYNNKSKEELEKIYKKELNRDIILGKTNIGVHHDDFEFILDDNNLRDFGSSGEDRNAIISLKLAEIDIFKKENNICPILILDDLFSELDANKINNILTFIPDDIQTFITTTELNKLNEDLKNESKIFIVNNGLVEEKEYE